MPKRQSREGFGRGLLESRWGEAKSGDVISSTGGSQILARVNLGRLIKLPDFRVVLAKREIWIPIGSWDGMLWQWRGGETAGMLHWGTPGSRLNSREVIGRWPGLSRYAGSPARWIFIGWPRRRGREVSRAGRWILIGRGCGLPPSSVSWSQASWKPWMNFCKRCGNDRCRRSSHLHSEMQAARGQRSSLGGSHRKVVWQ